MNITQYSPNEIGELWDKSLPAIRRRKLTFLFLYLISLIYLSIPAFQIPLLAYNRFYFTSLMEQRAIEENLLLFPSHSWTNINNVNPALLKAIISMEDGSFFSHRGIDWKELNTSLRVNKRRGRTTRGASTITMQTAKNLYLTTDRSFLRKGKELLITARMEKELPKKAILENYVNAIEWGEGIFGIKKAAAIYFDKHPSELNSNEASRLAAVIPSPLRHKPTDNSAYVLRRSSIIRGRLNDVILYPENNNEKKRIRKTNRRR
jgi:monofunctional glycosyltransferase